MTKIIQKSGIKVKGVYEFPTKYNRNIDLYATSCVNV